MADAEMTGQPVAGRSADLFKRAVTAVIMLAVAGAAYHIGRPWWAAFVLVLSLGVFWEWAQLVFAFARGPLSRGGWLVVGIAYIAIAAQTLAMGGSDGIASSVVLLLVLGVIATDVGAYFAGRSIGGPRIVPSISPNKTWAGLAGGMCASAAVFGSYAASAMGDQIEPMIIGRWVLFGAALAIVAQIGDFFQSWMKRRAGKKDSGRLLPGHGGLFDRLDGLMAVAFVAMVISWATGGYGL